MTPTSDFNESSMREFQNYLYFTRMSAQLNQTAIMDNSSDRYIETGSCSLALLVKSSQIELRSRYPSLMMANSPPGFDKLI